MKCSNPLCTGESKMAGMCYACYKYQSRHNGAMRDPSKIKYTKRDLAKPDTAIGKLYYPPGTVCVTCGNVRQSMTDFWADGECRLCYNYRWANGKARPKKRSTLPMCECGFAAVRFGVELQNGRGTELYNFCQDCYDAEFERIELPEITTLERLQR